MFFRNFTFLRLHLSYIICLLKFKEDAHLIPCQSASVGLWVGFLRVRFEVVVGIMLEVQIWHVCTYPYLV